MSLTIRVRSTTRVSRVTCDQSETLAQLREKVAQETGIASRSLTLAMGLTAGRAWTWTWIRGLVRASSGNNVAVGNNVGLSERTEGKGWMLAPGWSGELKRSASLIKRL